MASPEPLATSQHHELSREQRWALLHHKNPTLGRAVAHGGQSRSLQQSENFRKLLMCRQDPSRINCVGFRACTGAPSPNAVMGGRTQEKK